MSSNVDDRLSWLAMQYVLGELSDTDSDQFENRLAEDLAACEAVAEATCIRLNLHAAIASSVAGNSDCDVAGCESSVVQPASRNDAARKDSTIKIQRSRQAVAAAVVAVACLFLVMVVGWRDGSNSSQSRVASHSDRAAMELVSRWRTESKFADVEADDLDDELHDSTTDIAVPGWLLAGVSLEKHGVVDGQPEDLQDN